MERSATEAEREIAADKRLDPLSVAVHIAHMSLRALGSSRTPLASVLAGEPALGSYKSFEQS